MAHDDILRDHLLKLLDWRDAHVGFDAAIKDLAPELRGARPEGLPYSPWELLEHLRITQADILEFCREEPYTGKNWPADYWPSEPTPPSEDAWDRSIAAFRKDREELKGIAGDEKIDLYAGVPNGTGQTYLRELLLVADHNAYHLGELVVVRRALGAWGN